jgi:hypothetical protein
MIIDKKVNIKDLSLGSHVVINVKCDVCEHERTTSYKNYIRNTKKFTEPYCCSNNCAHKVNKNKNTCLKKYGDANYNNHEQTKETCLKKYGAKNPMQNNEIKNKAIKTNNIKYQGNSPSCLLEIKIKQKQVKLEKYGNENFNNRAKAKETNIKKYNCEYPMQNQDSFEKNQTNGYKLKIHEPTGLKYRGSYEKHFLDYCFENKIQIENHKSIKYEFEGKKKVYYPDFYLKEKNLIIEIKSNYTYEKYLNKNLAKQKSCLKQGYNFIFIINKSYKEFSNFFIL